MSKITGRFPIARIVVLLVVLVASCAAASAYTLVMRSGRIVQIPDQFVVSTDNLTYEVSSGIQVSVQLVSIDIPRTERANNEAPGSFGTRRVQQPDPPSATPSTNSARQTAKRVITNRDLESFRARRIQSENAYERRRVELGLPTVAESRQRAALESNQIRAEIRDRLTAEKDAEQYWRGRASELRGEIAATDAQIQYVRNRLNELPDNSNPIVLGDPYGYNSPIYGMGYPYDQRSVWTARTNGGRITVNTGQPGYPGRIYRGRRPYGRYGSPYPYGNSVYWPSQSYDNSYERSELTSQLDQLNRQRITLDIRWRQLEEEARRAGAYPGWLRP